ncbi:unnamed protein product, partial [Ixodes hexagonus]
LSPREVCSLDKFRINPRSNTITVSTPDEDRQLAYLQIRSLVIGGKTHEVTAHMATPSDLTRIVVTKALSFDRTEDAEDILLSCIGQNRNGRYSQHDAWASHERYWLPYEARGPRHTSTLMASLSPVSRTDIKSRHASTVDERVTVPTCVPCQPRAGATAAEPNTRRKTKMARTTSASPCAICGGRHITVSKECSHRYVRHPEGRGPAPPEPEKQPRRPRTARSLSLPWRTEAEALPRIEVSRRIASTRKTGRRGRLQLRPVLSPRWSWNSGGRSPTFNDN